MEIRTPVPRSPRTQAVSLLREMPAPVTDRTDEPSDRELFLALRTAERADRERIQHALVRRHGGLVRWLAAGYAGRGIDDDELRQVGYVGLVLAMRRFDPDYGTTFRTFATPTVKGEIQRYFRDKRRWIQLPRRMQEIKAALGEVTEVLTQTLRRPPTAAELADYLDLDVALVLEASITDTFAITSLDQQLGEGWDDATIGDTIGIVDPRLDLLIDCDAARPLIAALPARMQLILYLRFYNDRTQAQIGAELGISQMQVSRLLTRTLAGLRAKLVDSAA